MFEILKDLGIMVLVYPIVTAAILLTWSIIDFAIELWRDADK